MNTEPVVSSNASPPQRTAASDAHRHAQRTRLPSTSRLLALRKRHRVTAAEAAPPTAPRPADLRQRPIRSHERDIAQELHARTDRVPERPRLTRSAAERSSLILWDLLVVVFVVPATGLLGRGVLGFGSGLAIGLLAIAVIGAGGAYRRTSWLRDHPVHVARKLLTDSLANTFVQAFIAYRRSVDLKAIRDTQDLVQRKLSTLTPQERNGPRGRALSASADQLAVLASLQTGNAEIAQQADVPSAPSSPKPIRNGLIGLIAGTLLGVCWRSASIGLIAALRTPMKCSRCSRNRRSGPSPRVGRWSAAIRRRPILRLSVSCRLTCATSTWVKGSAQCW